MQKKNKKNKKQIKPDNMLELIANDSLLCRQVKKTIQQVLNHILEAKQFLNTQINHQRPLEASDSTHSFNSFT